MVQGQPRHDYGECRAVEACSDAGSTRPGLTTETGGMHTGRGARAYRPAVGQPLLAGVAVEPGGRLARQVHVVQATRLAVQRLLFLSAETMPALLRSGQRSWKTPANSGRRLSQSVDAEVPVQAAMSSGQHPS